MEWFAGVIGAGESRYTRTLIRVHSYALRDQIGLQGLHFGCGLGGLRLACPFRQSMLH